MYICKICAEKAGSAEFANRQKVRAHLRLVHGIRGYDRTPGTGKRYTSVISPEHEVLK